MRGISACLTLAALVVAAVGDQGVPGGELGAVECKKATIDVWHLPYPGDCTKFIKCDIIGKLSTIYTCDSPLHFNTKIQTCDWPENAGCEGGGGIHPTQKPTTQKPTTQKPTTQKPTTQKPTTQKPTTQKPTTQKPKPSTLPPVIPTTSNGYEVVCKDATPDRWHLPFPGDCTKFIKCDYIGHLFTVYTCDKPLHFNPSIQTCDWPENAGCESGGSSEDSGSSDSSDSEDSSESSESGEYSKYCKDATSEVWHLPYPGDCTKFIKCDYIGHLFTVYTCDKPLHFNPSIQTCDWQQNAGCASGGSSQSSGSNEEGGNGGGNEICKDATEHRWHLPHPTEPTMFYKCELNTGIAHLFICPEGLVFNPTIQVCDWSK